MTELDVGALEKLRLALEKRLERQDRWERTRPLREAMGESILNLITNITPELMAPPIAQSRKAALKLQQSLAEFPDRLRESEEEMQRLVNSAKLRTAALRRWLDKLS